MDRVPTIVRPHYVVGPGDSTDRFTYWVARTARGGQCLRRAVRAIRCSTSTCAISQRSCVTAPNSVRQGRFNACTPPGAHTMGELMETGQARQRLERDLRVGRRRVHQKNGMMAKGEIPIWLPSSGPFAGALLVSSARAVQQGLRFRNLETTVRDTLEWHNKRPAEAAAEARCGPHAGARSRVAEAAGGAEGLK
jgi:2'-hydroxyisoflavone reductase